MARTALTVLSESVTAGVNLTDGDAAANVDGNSFANPSGTVKFYANNASAGAYTITFQTPQTVAGGIAVAEVAVSVGAGEAFYFGPFPKGTFNQANGTVNVDYSGVTTLTVAAIDS